MLLGPPVRDNNCRGRLSFFLTFPPTYTQFTEMFPVTCYCHLGTEDESGETLVCNRRHGETKRIFRWSVDPRDVTGTPSLPTQG